MPTPRKPNLDFTGPAPGGKPPPADALPGTASKLRLLRERVRLRQELHQKADVVDPLTSAVETTYQRNGKLVLGAVITETCEVAKGEHAATGLPRAFGARLAVLRRRNNLSLAELAQLVGAHRTSLIHWEQGDALPNLAHAIALGKALHVTLAVLAGVEA